LRGPKHKRYLLLTSETPIDESARKELTLIISKRFPHLVKKAVWFERGVIVKTDNVEVEEAKSALEISAGGAKLRSTLTSGSIGKLKKAVPR
jgi:hypothetical protein